MQANRIFIDKKKIETIEHEVTIKQSVFVDKCEGTTIRIKGKFSQLNVENSNKLVIHVETLIGTLSVNKCQDIKIIVCDRVDSFQLDDSTGVVIQVKETKNLVVSHTSCRDCTIEKDSKKITLPTSFESVFKGKDFVHTIKDAKINAERPKNATLVENKKVETIEIAAADKSYAMVGCEGTTLVLKGKLASLSIENSKKVVVTANEIAGSVHVSHCNDVKLLITGKCNAILMDQTTKVMIQVAKAEGFKIDHMSCKELNVMAPEGDDLKEHPLPTTLVSKFKDGALTNEVLEGM